MSDLILDIFFSRLFRFHVLFLGTLYFNAYSKYHMFLLLFFHCLLLILKKTGLIVYFTLFFVWHLPFHKKGRNKNTYFYFL